MKKFILLIIFLIIFAGIGGYLFVHQNISYTGTINIKQGDNFSKVTNKLSSPQKIRIKLYTKLYNPDLQNIAVGLYTFSGEYKIADFIQVLLDGPSQQYISYTVLEGWSSYDIDNNLTQKGLITKGEFLEKTKGKAIEKVLTQYPRLKNFQPDKLKKYGLDGFLYPDTYYIDTNKDIVDQLITHHLTTFNKKIRSPYQQDFLAINDRLKQYKFKKLTLSPRAIINLAAVIEKEEKNVTNKPTIAGVFLNRLEYGMQLGADITICYGLKLLHSDCTPAKIVADLKNPKNLYNTRIHAGLTPSPIVSPSLASVKAVLSFDDTDFIYYLHDSQGGIHFGKTLQEHNFNKSKYLQ